MQCLRNVIEKKLLQLGIDKPDWQEGFFDHLLRSREGYAQKWEYVRMNPVRAKRHARRLAISGRDRSNSPLTSGSGL